MADLPYSEPVKCYLASQLELELAVSSLVEQLEEAGKLEDTVIVLSADHYPYGLTDEEYSELLGHTVDPVFEIYENSLILWSADMEEPVYVDKYCSSLDLLPTLSNLFGLEYDSRLMMGSDILSDEPALVIFANWNPPWPSCTFVFGFFNTLRGVGGSLAAAFPDTLGWLGAVPLSSTRLCLYHHRHRAGGHSIRQKGSGQPAGLGLNYFREER
mgnify:CR=1 FL=1